MQIPFLGFLPRPILDPASNSLLESVPPPGRRWEHTWHAVTRPPGRHVNDWFKIVPAHKPSLVRAQSAPEGARRIPPARRRDYSGIDLNDWHSPVRAFPTSHGEDSIPNHTTRPREAHCAARRCCWLVQSFAAETHPHIPTLSAAHRSRFTSNLPAARCSRPVFGDAQLLCPSPCESVRR